MSNSTTLEKKVKVKALPDYKMDKNGGYPVRASIQGETYAETLYMGRWTRPPIKKINAKEYVNLNTGEIFEYELREGKYDDSLRKTFMRLRALIRTNFESDVKNQIFITLTYADRQISIERLYEDFKKFMMRLKYRYPWREFEYIAVCEPQQDGTWHMHVMLKAINSKTLYIKHDVLQAVWGQGIAYVEVLKSVDDVGAYYVTYFTDLLDETKEGTKKRQKAERLKFYPKNFNFYRCSRGIQKPEKIDTYASVMQELYGEPTFEETYAVVDKDTEQAYNLINKRVYKRKKDSVDESIVEKIKEHEEIF